MPEQPPPRRRFRLVRWSLFGLALVGLGFLLHDWLSPWPRYTIPFKSATSIGSMSPDGHFLATGKSLPAFGAFLGGGLNNMGGVGPLGGPGPVGIPPPPWVQGGGLDNPIQVWDTHSGNLEGTYLKETGKDTSSWKHEFSASFRFMAVCEYQPDAGPFENHFWLVDFHAKKETRLPLKGNPDFHFSPQENFVLVSEQTEKENKIFHLVRTATGKVENTFHGTSFHGFVPDESLLVYEAQGNDGVSLHIWDTRTRRTVKSLKNARQPVLSPDGKTLAASMPDSLIFLDLTTLQMRHFRPLLGLPPEMLFSPDGKTLGIFLYQVRRQGPLDMRERSGIGVELWDVAAGKKLRGDFDKLKNWTWNSWSEIGISKYALFSPDSALFALTGEAPEGPRFAVWDVSSAALLWLRELDGPDCQLAVTTDSRLLIAKREKQVEIQEARTGKKQRVFVPNGDGTCDLTSDLRFITIHSETIRQPHLLEKLLGDWWPSKANSKRQQVKVAEVATGREFARLESESLEAWLSEDGQTLVTKHIEEGKYLARIWDLPLRPPLLLVVGIPLALGLMVFLFSGWRARRRLRRESAKAASASSV